MLAMPQLCISIIYEKVESKLQFHKALWSVYFSNTFKNKIIKKMRSHWKTGNCLWILNMHEGQKKLGWVDNFPWNHSLMSVIVQKWFNHWKSTPFLYLMLPLISLASCIYRLSCLWTWLFSDGHGSALRAMGDSKYKALLVLMWN